MIRTEKKLICCAVEAYIWQLANNKYIGHGDLK